MLFMIHQDPASSSCLCLLYRGGLRHPLGVRDGHDQHRAGGRANALVSHQPRIAW
jgi:hypothetical protein